MNTAGPTTDLRPALEAELRRLREETDVGRRMTALEVLLSREGEAAQMPAPSVAESRPTGRRGPGVSQAKLRAVAQYMQAHGEARQVDIHRDLEENSGTVSLAVNWLANQGDLEDTGMVENKSKIWRWTGEPPEDNGRITKLEPGVGVSEGRKR